MQNPAGYDEALHGVFLIGLSDHVKDELAVKDKSNYFTHLFPLPPN